MHLKATAGCQISTLIFGFRGSLCISYDNLPKDGKVLCLLGFNSKVLSGPLTDFKCLCGFLHLKPTVGCQISTLIFEKKLYGRGSL